MVVSKKELCYQSPITMSKRNDCITFDEYFMMSAVIASQRSKDPSTQVGAVIVNDEKRVISMGYNGFCNGVSDDNGKWGKDDTNPLNNKYMYVCHAEMNAITHATTRMNDCTIYVTHYPCHECAKLIIQTGIKKVVFANKWRDGTATTMASSYLFDAVGVVVEEYNGIRNLKINF